MVESKSVVLQMIPHTLFIEWDFWTLFTHCSLAVLLFMTLFTSCFTVHNTIHELLALLMTLFTKRYEVTVHIYGTVHVYGTVYIYGTIYTTSFFSLNVHF